MGKASEIWKEIKPKIGEMLMAAHEQGHPELCSGMPFKRSVPQLETVRN